METKRWNSTRLRSERSFGCQRCPEIGWPELPCALTGDEFLGICHYHKQRDGSWTSPPPAELGPSGRWESTVR